MIGADAYGVLRNLLVPQRPKNKSFDELKEVLIGHYSPKPLLIAERFKFHRHNQLESESVAQFVVELKRLALKCDFGAFLEEALRDRLVCGLKNIHIQKKLSEGELTFKKAFETAQSMELANKEDIRDVFTTGDESVKKVDKVATSRRPQRESDSCFNCDKSMLRQSAGARPHSVTDVKKEVILCNQKCDAHNKCYVEIVSPSASADDEMCGRWLYTLTSADQRRSGYQVQLLLEGKPVKMEVDTGSAVSIISETADNKLFQHLPVKPTHFYLKTYSGEWLTLLGEFKVG